MADRIAFDAFIAELREVFFALRAVTERLSNGACTGGERSMLAELAARGPQTVPDMARRRARSRQAMQKLVDRCVEHGWVTFDPNPRHRRSQLVAIAPAGKKLFAALRAKELAALESVKLPVSVAELARTTETLAELRGFFTAIVEAR